MKVAYPTSHADAMALSHQQTTADVVKMNRLRDAMRDSSQVDFLYDGKLRVVEVHAIGTSTKDGSLVMRGFQVGGQASRPLPQWTLFSVGKMEILQTIATPSAAPREGYAQGDKQMAQIIAEIAL